MKRKIQIIMWLLFFVVTIITQEACQSDHYLAFKDVESLQKHLRWSPDREPIISAHRGGPMSGFPENCIETFENALKYAPCLIECDVAKTKDSMLVMMHDHTLDRTTTGHGYIGDYTLAELKELHLKDNQGAITDFKIPTLSEVLDWGRGRAIVELDIKRSISPEEIVAIIESNNAASYTMVITYNISDAQEYHRLNPQLVISATARSVDGVQRLLNSGIDTRCLVAFTGVSEPDPAVYQLLHDNGMMAILGTMGNLDRRAEKLGEKVYRDLVIKGADILATDNIQLAAKILNPE
ncbi:MAG: glycerophosphodiester phosphodiesterase family protein [Candidatus Marinimicrobia bacterium]|nr:glycerophosphodiester phosphodiesterase family protein [Candidatus Neomarinimicrobiota bacterium]